MNANKHTVDDFDPKRRFYTGMCSDRAFRPAQSAIDAAWNNAILLDRLVPTRAWDGEVVVCYPFAFSFDSSVDKLICPEAIRRSFVAALRKAPGELEEDAKAALRILEGREPAPGREELLDRALRGTRRDPVASELAKAVADEERKARKECDRAVQAFNVFFNSFRERGRSLARKLCQEAYGSGALPPPACPVAAREYADEHEAGAMAELDDAAKELAAAHKELAAADAQYKRAYARMSAALPNGKNAVESATSKMVAALRRDLKDATRRTPRRASA